MEQQEQEVLELTDLDVESVGLVLRGANRKPFYVIKSEEVEMSENEDFATILDELENVSEVNESAWQKVVGVLKSLTARPAEPEPEPEQETSSEEVDETEDFAQVVAQMKQSIEEQFAAKLEQEREARRVIEEAFAQEQRKRRLVEFGTVVEEYSSLPGTGEQFAADLMAIHDSAGEEVYGRVSAILKAANEAIEKGALFAQFSVGGSEAGTGDPFENAVEVLRKERFPTDEYNEGWAKAFDLAMGQHPDLAAAYARKH